MTHVSVRTGDDRLVARHDEHADVPAWAERQDRPIAQRLREDDEHQHRRRQRRQKWPLQQDHPGTTRDEERRVQQLHHLKVPLPDLDRAPSARQRRVAAADRELDQPLDAEEREENEVPAHHRRRTSSAQRPGPSASRSPHAPGGGRCASIVSRNTINTDALERLPTRRSWRIRRSRLPGISIQ